LQELQKWYIWPFMLIQHTYNGGGSKNLIYLMIHYEQLPVSKWITQNNSIAVTDCCSLTNAYGNEEAHDMKLFSDQLWVKQIKEKEAGGPCCRKVRNAHRVLVG
jgi:hypothetical protein